MGVNYMYNESGKGHSPSKAVIRLGEKKLGLSGRCFSWLPDLTLHYVQYNPLNPATRPSVEVTIACMHDL